MMSDFKQMEILTENMLSGESERKVKGLITFEQLKECVASLYASEYDDDAYEERGHYQRYIDNIKNATGVGELVYCLEDAGFDATGSDILEFVLSAILTDFRE